MIAKNAGKVNHRTELKGGLLWEKSQVNTKESSTTVVIQRERERDSFKYHAPCTVGKISVRINLLFYIFFHRRPIQNLCFFPVGLSLLIQHFQQVLWALKFLLSPGMGSWQLGFKSLIIVIVGFRNVCLLLGLGLNSKINSPG